MFSFIRRTDVFITYIGTCVSNNVGEERTSNIRSFDMVCADDVTLFHFLLTGNSILAFHPRRERNPLHGGILRPINLCSLVFSNMVGYN